MPTPLRRTLRNSALTLTALLAAGILYTMFNYHSINIFTPPERLESLGRTYQLSNLPPSTLEEIHQRHSPSHREQYTLEHVSNLWPRHPIYQFQNNEIQGQTTTSAYLKWGNKYTPYQLLGAPKNRAPGSVTNPEEVRSREPVRASTSLHHRDTAPADPHTAGSPPTDLPCQDGAG